MRLLRVQIVGVEYRQLWYRGQFKTKPGGLSITYISDKWPMEILFFVQPAKERARLHCLRLRMLWRWSVKEQCIYQSKGDSLQTIVQKDKDESQRKIICALVGLCIALSMFNCD